MTMRSLYWGVLAAGLTVAASSTSWASDVIRLGGPSAQASIEGGTDTELVRGRGGYGHGYGRGYAYGRGYYGGYGRGYYAGYGRGYYGYGYYPYYYPPYYVYRPYYYYPIAGDGAPVLTLQGQSNYQPAPSPSPQPLMPPAYNYNNNGDGTFPYDGGPRNPIPVPAGNTAPMKGPRGNIPLDGKLVSLPTTTTGGFSPVTTPDMQRFSDVSTNAPAQSSAAPARLTYPAYGEQAIPPAPRKTINR
jgi:hypothetical protein